MMAVIRIRGAIGTRSDVRDTFRHLRLAAANQMVVLADTPAYAGMAKKVCNHATFGTIDARTLAQVIAKRGRMEGNAKVELQKTGAKSMEEIAQKVVSGEKKLSDFGVKPVFRLSPPKKGFERGGIKKPFSSGGALGARGDKITELIAKMI